MSKQSQSDALKKSPSAKNGVPPQKMSVRYWERRLLKPSFTRNGVRKQVNHWAIKLQHEGVRRCLSLGTESRREAAHRALEISRHLTTGGWPEVESFLASSAPWFPSRRTTSDSGGTKTSSYWTARLSQRGYLAEAGQKPANQLSVRVERGGVSEFFPTGTTNPKEAIQFANQLDKDIQAKGWPSVLRTYPREVTVALFWSTGPITCTYSTMVTILDHRKAPARAHARPSDDTHPLRQTLIVEPDAQIRATLAHWIAKHPGFAPPNAVHDIPSNQDPLHEADYDLILVNRQTQHATFERLIATGAGSQIKTAVISHGLYEDSNQIFHSVGGVDLGYALRRRKPDRILAPILTSPPDAIFRSYLPTAVQTYFQNLFAEVAHPNSVSQLSLLTRRELEILEQLSAGYLDKEIAHHLRISNWTVRNHLKNIYSKLGIHNRTEAVIQYLQK